MYETEFVAAAIDALAGFAEEFVDEILEARFLLGGRGGSGAYGRVAAREELDDAVGHVHLVVEVAALQEVELPVELGADTQVGELSELVAAHEAAVETTDDVVADAGGVGRVEVNLHAQPSGGRQFAGGGHGAQSFYEAVEDGALAGAVAAAEHVDVGPHVPHDVFVAAPEAVDFYARDAVG